jgi:hypothetical protein
MVIVFLPSCRGIEIPALSVRYTPLGGLRLAAPAR